jgi:hypothetical protein
MKCLDVPCTKSQILFLIARSSYQSSLRLLRFSQNQHFLWCETVSFMPNPQPGGPGYPFSSGSSPLTSPEWEVLPVAMLLLAYRSRCFNHANPTTMSSKDTTGFFHLSNSLFLTSLSILTQDNHKMWF